MSSNQNTIFRANGKLLITGEYLVLKGAKALALPLMKGQTLSIKPHDKGLKWKAHAPHGVWFDALFNEHLQLQSTNDALKGSKLEEILQKVIELNPACKSKLNQSLVETRLEFDPEWGWGSSSTLIALLSLWLNLNPYKLLDATFGGSGYDIASALHDKPIFYQIDNGTANVEEVSFDPPFKDHIYFIYSGKKQNSQREVKRFTQEAKVTPGLLNDVNNISEAMISSKELVQFGRLIEEHELLISSIVQLKQIKIEHFNDFEGYIKALGAWGGDFFMVLSAHDEKYVKQYFNKNGLNTIFRYKDIVLNSKK